MPFQFGQRACRWWNSRASLSRLFNALKWIVGVPDTGDIPACIRFMHP